MLEIFQKRTLHLEESLRMKRSLYGDRDHPDIAATLHALGQVSRAAGDLPEAKQVFGGVFANGPLPAR